jgi:hypothetical protein
MSRTHRASSTERGEISHCIEIELLARTRRTSHAPHSLHLHTYNLFQFTPPQRPNLPFLFRFLREKSLSLLHRYRSYAISCAQTPEVHVPPKRQSPCAIHPGVSRDGYIASISQRTQTNTTPQRQEDRHSDLQLKPWKECVESSARSCRWTDEREKTPKACNHV